jgi:hypothetical protein
MRVSFKFKPHKSGVVGGAMKNLEVRRIEVWATKVSFYFYSTLRYF